MRHNQRGFTLVETVVALMVTSALIFVIIDFMISSIAQYTTINARSGLLNDAQTALNVIGNDVRLSGNADENNRIPDPYAPGAPSNDLSWISDSDTLILATAAEDNDKNIIFADPALYISQKNNNIYFVSNQTLYKRTLAAAVGDNAAVTTCPASNATSACPADKILLRNVTSFTVKYFNAQDLEVTPTEARSIEIYVKLQEPDPSQPVSADYTTRMVFRND